MQPANGTDVSCCFCLNRKCKSIENNNEKTKNVINVATGNATHNPINKNASPNPKTSLRFTFSLNFEYPASTKNMIPITVRFITEVLQNSSKNVRVKYRYPAQLETIKNRNQQTFLSLIS